MFCFGFDFSAFLKEKLTLPFFQTACIDNRANAHFTHG